MQHLGSFLRHGATSIGAVGLYESVDWQRMIDSDPQGALIALLVFVAGFVGSLAKNKV